MIELHVTAAGGPIYQQLIQQITAARARGELQAGAKLPTVQELAAQLNVNRNTVAHAYRSLRAAGVVDSQPGRGTWIAGGGRDEPAAYDRLRQQIEPAIHEALRQGIAPPMVGALVQQITGSQMLPAAETGPSGGGDLMLRYFGSHDFCLDVLARQLQARDPRLRLHWTAVGSKAGLVALGQGAADLAGVHMLDHATGAYNRPFVAQQLPSVEVRLVTLAYREQGLIVRAGNPLGLRVARDLATPGVRFASRQAGSGTRVLLDQLLAQRGVVYAQLAPVGRDLTTHLAAAAAVAGGSADAGLGVRAAAVALGLDFVPLAQERFDLAFRRADEQAPWFPSLIEVLASPDFRAEIEQLPGYDASRTAWFY